jgi:hypothetical protein
MRYTINTADNGWIVEWWEEGEDEPFEHFKVFEIPEDCDTATEDPQVLIDLLYFVKEDICGQYSSKHKRKNIRVIMEDGEDAGA